MIDRDEAKKQAMRLGQMLGFPKDNREALSDLVDGFQNAESQDVAKGCASAFLDTAESDTRCPLASQIRRWIYDHQEGARLETQQRIAACNKCGGTGYQTIERGIYTGVKDCECRRAREVVTV